MLQIFCKNTGTSRNVKEGATLLDVLSKFKFDQPYRIVSAKVNNVSQGLKYRVYQNKEVEFLDLRDRGAMRAYCRSLCYLLSKAVYDVFPDSRLYMEHPISHGYFCNLRKADHSPVTEDDIDRIKTRMREIVDADVMFHCFEDKTENVIKLFQEKGLFDKAKLLETTGEVYSDYYTLDGYVDYYYGRLVPSAGYLQVWDVIPYHKGMLLCKPDREDPSAVCYGEDQPKTFDIFTENLKWETYMGMSNAGDINSAVLGGKASELIQVAEALQSKKIVQIAEEIERRYRDPENPLKVVLITGPSSSGKTTFCKRLSVQLMACGLRPMAFSTDDYFVNRVDTPLLPDGSYDFDNFDNVDHEMLSRDVTKLLAGETVEVPEYNFTTGLREYNGKKLRLGRNTVLIIEGLHALNPALIKGVEESAKFRVFINTLTAITLDEHNWVPTNDNRLLRRIIRDYNKGAFSARETISQWPKVCEAEKLWIYPYQELADAMFNSAYLIEFAVIRRHAEPILRMVPKNVPEYSEAYRLLKFLSYFVSVSDKEIPSTSLIREFIG